MIGSNLPIPAILSLPLIPWPDSYPNLCLDPEDEDVQI